jgi:acyl-CoA thioester hydrolase
MNTPAGVTDTCDRPEVSVRIALRKSQMDGLGHLNQARYHDLLGTARATVLSGTVRATSAAEGRFVVAHTELDYLREVRLADRHVDVHARIESVGQKSVVVSNEIVRPDGTVAARGSATMVAWDAERRRSRLLTDRERAAFGG